MKGTSGGRGQSSPLQMGFSPDSTGKVHFQERVGLQIGNPHWEEAEKQSQICPLPGGGGGLA